MVLPVRYSYCIMPGTDDSVPPASPSNKRSRWRSLSGLAVGVSSTVILVLLCNLFSCSSTDRRVRLAWRKYFKLNKELAVLRAAYPELHIESAVDPEVGDWRITISKDGEPSTVLYWAEGRYLPKDLLAQKESYRRLIFYIPKEVPDPSTFTPAHIEEIRDFGSSESRDTAPVSLTALFEVLYDTASRAHVEQHIVKMKFLGKQVSVHEAIVPRLARVEAKILEVAQTDAAVKAFVQSISSIDGYSWRQIRDTNGISFHSMGLAIDILPRGWQNKIIYWNWEKNKGNEDWMLIPLPDRWMPPERVIDIFEEEGFVWGGKWTVWDDMHFEYRPELILGRGIAE